MKLATWNVNGIRARKDRVIAWLEDQHPDVLCLQELKVDDAGFPQAPFQALGYEVATFGQKAYNGVAILSRGPLSDVERGFDDGGGPSEARIIAATVAGVQIFSVYVPNGQAPGTEKYQYKLAWLDRLRRHLVARLKPDTKAVFCGDLNVAPTDLDVHDPDSWREQILCSTLERRALEAVRAEAGLIDIVRALHPDDVLYTWWDYRRLAFPRNHGLRIDHVFVTLPLAETPQKSARVDRQARKGKDASDHAPLIIEL